MTTEQAVERPLQVKMAAPAALALVLAVSLFRQSFLSHVIPTYASDDAYIHLAVARHIVTDRVWGNTAYEFASCSSSPLWTALLALCTLALGPSPWLPLLLNLAALAALFSIADRWSRFGGLSITHRLGVQIALLLCFPAVFVSAIGMEHVLQAALVLWFMLASWRKWTLGGPAWPVVLSSLLLGGVRFESALLIIAIAVLGAVLKRSYLMSFLTVVSGLLPACAFALLSKLHGGSLLPDSLLVKIGSYGLADSLRNIYDSGLSVWLGFGLLVSLLAPPEEPELRGLCWAFVGCACLQAAAGGWPIRYSAWLMPPVVVLGAIVATRLAHVGPSRLIQGTICLFAFLTIPPSLILIRMGSHSQQNYREMQLPLAQFISAEPADRTIGLYDIGLCSYLAKCHLVDFAGLGSSDVAEARMSHRFGTTEIRNISRKRRLNYAVLFPNQFLGSMSLPSEWILVATWSIDDNVVLLDDKFAFYATSPREANILRDRLQAFEGKLPTSLHQTLAQ